MMSRLKLNQNLKLMNNHILLFVFGFAIGIVQSALLFGLGYLVGRYYNERQDWQKMLDRANDATTDMGMRSTQFIEPVSDKEKFDAAREITDLTHE